MIGKISSIQVKDNYFIIIILFVHKPWYKKINEIYEFKKWLNLIKSQLMHSSFKRTLASVLVRTQILKESLTAMSSLIV